MDRKMNDKEYNFKFNTNDNNEYSYINNTISNYNIKDDFCIMDSNSEGELV